MEKITFIDNVTKANANTFNTMQDNIEDGIEEKQTYSTEEIQIGTFLSKPLYRKVVEATLSTVNTWVYLNLNNNIDRLVNIYGYYIPTNYSQNRYSILRSTNDFLVQTSENGKLVVKTSDSNALTTWTIVLEYTKTTD